MGKQHLRSIDGIGWCTLKIATVLLILLTISGISGVSALAEGPAILSYSFDTARERTVSGEVYGLYMRGETVAAAVYFSDYAGIDPSDMLLELNVDSTDVSENGLFLYYSSSGDGMYYYEMDTEAGGISNDAINLESDNHKLKIASIIAAGEGGESVRYPVSAEPDKKTLLDISDPFIERLYITSTKELYIMEDVLEFRLKFSEPVFLAADGLVGIGISGETSFAVNAADITGNGTDTLGFALKIDKRLSGAYRVFADITNAGLTDICGNDIYLDSGFNRADSESTVNINSMTPVIKEISYNSDNMAKDIYMHNQRLQLWMEDDDLTGCIVKYYWSKEYEPAFTESLSGILDVSDYIAIDFNTSWDLTNDEGVYYLHVKITDKDGNYTILSKETKVLGYYGYNEYGVQGVCVDTKAPAVSLSPASAYNLDAAIPVTITDNGAGLSGDELKIELYQVGNPEPIGTAIPYTSVQGAKSNTLSIKLSDFNAALADGGSYYFKLHVRDCAASYFGEIHGETEYGEATYNEASISTVAFNLDTSEAAATLQPVFDGSAGEGFEFTLSEPAYVWYAFSTEASLESASGLWTAYGGGALIAEAGGTVHIDTGMSPGVYNMFLKIKDEASNEKIIKSADQILIPDIPSGTAGFDNEYTNTCTANLLISMTVDSRINQAVNPIEKYYRLKRYSQKADGSWSEGQWSEWQDYTRKTVLPVQFDDEEGLKKAGVQYCFKYKARTYESEEITDTITYDKEHSVDTATKVTFFPDLEEGGLTNTDIITTITPGKTSEVVITDQAGDVLVEGSFTAGGSGIGYTFTENMTVYAEITDLSGNKELVEIVMDSIDKTVPVLSLGYALKNSDTAYDSVAKTSDQVIATLTADEPVYILNNNGSASRTFTENGTFEFVVQDLAGNVAKITASVDKIDSTKPVLTLSYSTKDYTNSDVTVTVTADRPVTFLNNNGSGTLVFPENSAKVLIIEDELGNIIYKYITINNIDKEAPKMVCEDNRAILHTAYQMFDDSRSNLLEGITFVDNVDGDITDSAVVTHNVDISRQGTYYIKYAIADTLGNTAEYTREVVVVGTGEITTVINGSSNTSGTVYIQGDTAGLEFAGIEGNYKVLYDIGKYKSSYFKTTKKEITGDTLTVTQPGWYTIFISDQERKSRTIYIYFSL